MEEIWKDIEGYEGLYQISTKGRCKSFYIYENGSIIKPKKYKDGYYGYRLTKDGHQKIFRAHRLVALTFIPNDDPINKTEVGHKDETRTNNCVENLEWVTPKENSNMPLRIKRLQDYFNNNREIVLERLNSSNCKRGHCLYIYDEFGKVVLTEKEQARRDKISKYRTSVVRYITDDGEFSSLNEVAKFYGAKKYQLERYMKGMETKLKETLDTKHFRKVC